MNVKQIDFRDSSANGGRHYCIMRVFRLVLVPIRSTKQYLQYIHLSFLSFCILVRTDFSETV